MLLFIWWCLYVFAFFPHSFDILLKLSYIMLLLKTFQIYEKRLVLL